MARAGGTRAAAVAAAVLTAAVGIGGTAARSAAGTRPLALENGVEAGGYPLRGSGPGGVGVRFIDHGSLWIGVLLRNTSGGRVTILAAGTPEPDGSLVRQTGAGFAPYTPCTGDRLCPYLADPRHPPSRAPLTVEPHGYAAVELVYRLVSCRTARTATTASANELVVTYRVVGGAPAQQRFALRAAKLHPHRPAGVDCVPRPYSHIGLVGSFTTSPGHGTVPGSDGDTCTTSASGAVRFESRMFVDRAGITWRVAITLPRFRGPGLYGRAGGGAARGPAEVAVTGGFGEHGWTTFTDDRGVVTVTRAAAGRYGGRFRSVLSGHRRFFRAYGAWRCTTHAG